jgi:hypothetical protein
VPDPSSPVLHVPHVGMVYESEHAMLSELQRKISARKKKKKKKGVWRDLCIFFCGVATAASVLLLLPFAPLGRVEASTALRSRCRVVFNDV